MPIPLGATMDLNTLTIVASTAIFCVGLGWFISQKLNSVTNELYDALNKNKDDNNEKFTDHAIRITRVELQVFGYTHSGKNPDKMDLLS